MTELLLTLIIFATALVLMGITYVLTGKNNIHLECSATHKLDPNGEKVSCAFCPNEAVEKQDYFTTLAKVGYPNRQDIISEEAYEGKPRNRAIENLRYWDHIKGPKQ